MATPAVCLHQDGTSSMKLPFQLYLEAAGFSWAVQYQYLWTKSPETCFITMNNESNSFTIY